MQPVTIEDTDVKEVPEVLVKVESIANQHPVWNLNQTNMKKTKYFRLRLSDKVATERPETETDLRLT